MIDCEWNRKKYLKKKEIKKLNDDLLPEVC